MFKPPCNNRTALAAGCFAAQSAGWARGKVGAGAVVGVVMSVWLGGGVSCC